MEDIEKLKQKIFILESRISLLQEENEELQDEVYSLEEENTNILNRYLDDLNISKTTLDKIIELRYIVDIAKIEFLVENIDNIMLEDLENLIKR